MEDSCLTFMRNCILGGDNFGAFRGDKIQKGTHFNFTQVLVAKEDPEMFSSGSTRLKAKHSTKFSHKIKKVTAYLKYDGDHLNDGS